MHVFSLLDIMHHHGRDVTLLLPYILHVCCSDVSVTSASRLTKTARLQSSRRAGRLMQAELGPKARQGKARQGKSPLSRRQSVKRASRFPPPPTHYRDIHSTHRPLTPLTPSPPPPLPLTTYPPRWRERYPPASFRQLFNTSSAIASSEQVACLHNVLTARRAYSDEVVVAHWVGGLRRDCASKHRSGHIQRRVTRAHRHCCQAAQT
jgi:hypothetical protein